MTTAPSYVAVKRKRDDAPIQSLILEERRTKHARINVEYRLESVSQASNSQPGTSSTMLPPQAPPPATAASDNVAPPPAPPKPSGPRHFELATTSNKRSADAAGLLPTFVERPAKRPMPFPSTVPTPPAPQKRPGTRSATNGTSTRVLGKGAEPSASLAAALHAFAMEEADGDGSDEEEEEMQRAQQLAPAPDKPRVIVQPKRAVRRPKKDAEAMDTDDEDYVYDIYLLAGRTETAPQIQPPTLAAPPALASAPSASPAPTGPIDPSAPRTANLLPLNPDSTAPGSVLASLMGGDYNSPSSEGDVGYLILPNDEQESSYFWGASAPLPTDSDGDEDGEDDDDDSNAEDYYAADYPEDEVDGDDEMGVGEWRYRNRGGVSDDEDDFADVAPVWSGGGGGDGEGDGGEWSDSSIEADRSMNPWRRFGGRKEG